MLIAPSILSCDFARLGEEAAAIQAAGGDMLHVDVMDGHFVPNISLGVPVVASLRKATELFLDVHLMISNPLQYLDSFIEAGSDGITVHLECADTAELLRRISGAGLRAGLSISPDTPVDELLPFLPLCDLVLIMTVRPGFGGQSFLSQMMGKLDRVVQAAQSMGVSPLLQVDGGINESTAPIAAAHGANVLVAGSAVFGQPDYVAAITSIRRAAEGGLIH